MYSNVNQVTNATATLNTVAGNTLRRSTATSSVISISTMVVRKPSRSYNATATPSLQHQRGVLEIRPADRGERLAFAGAHHQDQAEPDQQQGD